MSEIYSNPVPVKCGRCRLDVNPYEPYYVLGGIHTHVECTKPSFEKEIQDIPGLGRWTPGVREALSEERGVPSPRDNMVIPDIPINDNTPGVKFDAGKPRMDLLSREALVGLSNVLAYGASKYAPDNWRKGMEWRRLVGAALRHLTAFMDGEDTDEESGLPHVDHALCCLMFLSEFQKTGNGTDDRWKAPR